jgi:hypothetical protein
MLSEARRIGVYYPHSVARSRSIPRIVYPKHAASRRSHQTAGKPNLPKQPNSCGTAALGCAIGCTMGPVMLSEARRIGVYYPHSVARSRSIPRIVYPKHAASRRSHQTAGQTQSAEAAKLVWHSRPRLCDSLHYWAGLAERSATNRHGLSVHNGAKPKHPENVVA